MAAVVLLAVSPVLASDARQSSFGKLPDGRDVAAVTLTNSHGVSARVMAYGATLQSLVIPDRHGKKADVVLGYGTIGDYVATPQYFGATVGRCRQPHRAAASSHWTVMRIRRR